MRTGRSCCSVFLQPVFLVWAECKLTSLQFSATGLLPSECQTSLREKRVNRAGSREFVRCCCLDLARALAVFLSAMIPQVHQVNEGLAITMGKQKLSQFLEELFEELAFACDILKVYRNFSFWTKAH